MQVVARSGGEWARPGIFSRAGCNLAAVQSESMSETETTAITCSWVGSPALARGCDNGVVLFFEVAQQLLFAQQCGLQPSALGAFDKMQEAAGNCSGRTSIASRTANRIGVVLRIPDR